MNKVLKTCIVMAAFAAFLVVPSIAAAVNEATVTAPTGTNLAAGSLIRGTNKETNGTHVIATLTDVNGNVLTQCTTATLTGTLKENSGTSVKGEVTAAEFIGTPNVTPHTTHCAGIGNITVTTNPATNGLPWCLRSDNTMLTDEFQVTGGECAKAPRPIRFILHSGLAGECTYERTTPVVGTYTTHPEDAILHVSKQKFTKVGGGGFCPGEGFLDLTQRLETHAGAGVWISKGK
jgi:hypothetical protein